MNPPVRIAVAGSLNVDHTLTVARLPRPGQTVTSTGALTCWGGKGANQAIAAARAGADVAMLACVGADDPGRRYRADLRGEGIDTSGIQEADCGTPTGSAFILVDASGENVIVVHPGANHALTPQMVEAQADLIREADGLLLQLECPLESVGRAAEIARAHGVPVFLNPSPWPEDFAAGRIPCDHLLVNESEAAAFLGEFSFEPPLLNENLLESSGLTSIIVTRGSRSTLGLFRDRGVVEVAPPRVEPIDTVGAGDSFSGALAVALAEGQSLENALRFANQAGALATLQSGAQAAIPTRTGIETALAAAGGGG